MTTYHNPSSIYAKESCNMVIEPCYARLFTLVESAALARTFFVFSTVYGNNGKNKSDIIRQV